MLLFIGAIGMILLSTTLGYIKIPPADIVRIIASEAVGSKSLAPKADQVFRYVVIDVRLPRILTATIVGAGLSVSGVVFQGILLNPLADPYTLGISAGAAFGASIALLLNFTFFGIYTVPMFAFVGAMATLLAVISLSSSNGTISSTNLILSGVIVTAILSAGISFIKYLADEEVAVIIFWLMGSFASKTWTDVVVSLLVVLVGVAVCSFFARDLNIISLGDRSAMSLGVDASKVRLLLLVVASFIAAVCVSVSGIIGFVGLIIPHSVRFLFGPDNRVVIPASAFVGGTLLLAADTVTRMLLPSGVPIGVLTALIGGPFFCFIFMKKKKEMIRDRGGSL